MFDIQQHRRNSLDHILNSFSKAVEDNDLKSAVAIIVKDGKVLLGKSNSKDERLGMYCFPGGRIDKGEDVYKAAVREAREEAGVVCEINQNSQIMMDSKLPGVGFIVCDYKSGIAKPNWEFENMKWFDMNYLPEDILEINRGMIKTIND